VTCSLLFGDADSWATRPKPPLPSYGCRDKELKQGEVAVANACLIDR